MEKGFILLGIVFLITAYIQDRGEQKLKNDSVPGAKRI